MNRDSLKVTTVGVTVNFRDIFGACVWTNWNQIKEKGIAKIRGVGLDQGTSSCRIAIEGFTITGHNLLSLPWHSSS